MQVDGYQRDADQAHMNPPFFHLELSGGGVAFLPLRDPGVMQQCAGTSRRNMIEDKLFYKMIFTSLQVRWRRLSLPPHLHSTL